MFGILQYIYLHGVETKVVRSSAAVPTGLKYTLRLASKPASFYSFPAELLCLLRTVLLEFPEDPRSVKQEPCTGRSPATWGTVGPGLRGVWHSGHSHKLFTSSAESMPQQHTGSATVSASTTSLYQIGGSQSQTRRPAEPTIRR